jgi:hypothetical protein
MATIAGSMMTGISTPYRRAGLLHQKWKDHFGKPDGDVLVVHGASRVFNPSLPERVIDDALRRDAAAARSEWLAEWRDDVAAFLSRELVEGAIDRDVTIRPPRPDINYRAFADPSGGLGDSFTCAVAHRDGDGRVWLDCLHDVRAPFDPGVATAEIAGLLKAYGVSRVTADKYAAQWPVAEFQRNNITLEHSERDRSAIYADFLPLLTSGRARLIDSPRLVHQLCGLERKASPMGRDRIDHPPNAHDDPSNSAAGALVLASSGSSLEYGDWVMGPADKAEAARERLFSDMPYFARNPWLLQ